MDFKRTLLAAALPFVFTLGSTAHALEIKFADIHPAGYPTVVAEEQLGKTLVAESNGGLTFKMFPGGVLGSEKEVVEQAQVGAIQMARVSLGIVRPGGADGGARGGRREDPYIALVGRIGTQRANFAFL